MAPNLQPMSEDAARAMLEKMRWPNGAICPKCGGVDPYKLNGRSTRKGVYKCRACRKQFTVTVGTIFEDSHIPLAKWLLAIQLLCASKKGMSAHQLHRMLGLTYKSAWFMAHRIRYAMTRPPLSDKLRGTVEADETFIGGKPHNRHIGKRSPAPPKTPVLSVIERGGNVRSVAVASVTAKTLRAAIDENVVRQARLMTDGAGAYTSIGRSFASHDTVDHVAGEYVRGDAHVNTAESYFSILKRGIFGVYHHVSEQHLGRYLAEFDQRWNTRRLADGERALLAVRGAEGRRLTYRPLTNGGAL